MNRAGDFTAGIENIAGSGNQGLGSSDPCQSESLKFYFLDFNYFKNG